MHVPKRLVIHHPNISLTFVQLQASEVELFFHSLFDTQLFRLEVCPYTTTSTQVRASRGNKRGLQTLINP